MACHIPPLEKAKKQAINHPQFHPIPKFYVFIFMLLVEYKLETAGHAKRNYLFTKQQILKGKMGRKTKNSTNNTKMQTT